MELLESRALLSVEGLFPGEVLPLGIDMLHAADLNGDGVLDLVGADHQSEEMLVALGRGDGSFATPVRYDAYVPEGLAMGDLNADGVIDIVAGTGSGFNIYHGVGDGTLSEPDFISDADRPDTDNWLIALAIADMHHDGLPDLVAAYSSGFSYVVSHVCIFDGAKGFAMDPVPLEVAIPQSLQTIDINLDGLLDIAVQQENLVPQDDAVQQEYSAAMFLNNGSGQFLARPECRYVGQARPAYGSVFVGDLDGDRIPDLVDPAAVHFGNGDGTFAAPVALPVAAGANSKVSITRPASGAEG